MSLLTETLLQVDERAPQRRGRMMSLARASTINMKDYRTSGIEFQRVTMKKTLQDGPIRRNIFVPVTIADEQQQLDDIVRQFKVKDMERSGLSYRSLDSNTEEFDVTQYEGDIFFNAKESLDVDRKISEIGPRASSIQYDRKVSVDRAPELLKKPLSPEKHQKSKRMYTKKYRAQKAKEKIVRNYSEIMSEFFGEGINSLILKLGDGVVKVLSFNLLFDCLFRFLLLLYCLQCYNFLEGKAIRFLFTAPLAAQLFSRILFFTTLIKMSFDEKRAASLAYQRSVQGKSGKEMEEDRMFLRQFTKDFYWKVLFRAMIPPQFYYFELQQRNNKLKIYFMLNMIFKGIEFVIVLSTLAVVLLYEFMSLKELTLEVRTIGFSLMLEQIIRYVVNYLVVNTFSN